MLQTQSPEQICTLAMQLLKRQPVFSLDDDDTLEAQNCNLWYPILRDQLLELYAWTFATQRVQLQQLSDIPPYQYCYYYAMPEDCIMPLEARADTWSADDETTYLPIGIYPPMGVEFTWLVEGANIITNASAVFLKYTQRVTQTGYFTPTFALALAYRIAGNLAYSMTGNDKLAATLIQLSDGEARRAQSRDAQKGTQESFPQEDSWIRSRNASFLFRNGSWQRQGQTE